MGTSKPARDVDDLDSSDLIPQFTIVNTLNTSQHDISHVNVIDSWYTVTGCLKMITAFLVSINVKLSFESKSFNH